MAQDVNRVKKAVNGIHEVVQQTEKSVGALATQTRNNTEAVAELKEIVLLGQHNKDLFFPFLHLGFDGSSGNNFVVPVEMVDESKTNRDLCVISIPSAEIFMAHESGTGVPVDVTRNFFQNTMVFPLARNLTYKDRINCFLKTGFAFLAVGEKWNWKKAENDSRLRIVEATFWKETLQFIDEAFPDRVKNRSELRYGAKPPSYKSVGLDIGFDVTTRRNRSVKKVARSFSDEEKKKFPVIGVPWVTEWYTPVVGKVFGVPDSLLGTKHIVGSKFSADSEIRVLSYKEGLSDYHKCENKKNKRKRVRSLPIGNRG